MGKLWSKSEVSDNVKYDELLKTISIDYSSQEVQDLQRSVFELLTKLKDKINENRSFNISRIEPCGSMVEKTSVWKHTNGDKPFIMIPEETELDLYTEFDYLAVLETPDFSFGSHGRCPLCLKAESSPITDDLLKKSWFGTIYKSGCEKFELDFLKILNSVILSCDCMRNADCIIQDYMFRKNIFKQIMFQIVTGCDKCTVYTPSGKLQFLPAGIIPATSLRFLWTSSSMSLHGVKKPNSPTRVHSESSHIKYLPVFIDFIPSFRLFKPNTNKNELQYECFIVSKRCVALSCDDTWRKSDCFAEIDHMLHTMSDKHRNCFKILKYFNQQEHDYDEVPSYHLKTIVLNHSLTCTNSSQDYQPCLNGIVRELKQAYDSCDLRCFSTRENLLKYSITLQSEAYSKVVRLENGLKRCVSEETI